MKESKFNDIPGLEETNTPVQLDSFEASAMYALKDRYIFDLSLPLGKSNSIYTSDYYDDGDAVTRKTYYLYSNNTAYDQSFENVLGIPGNLEVIFKNHTGISTQFSPIDPPAFFESVDGVPFWNKNAAMYLGIKTLGAYGQGAGTDAIKAFRSGYIEFTIKTDNQNCIISYGSAKQSSFGALGVLPSAQYAAEGSLLSDGQPTFINNEIAVSNEYLGNLNTFTINIKNGKLQINYEDEVGTTQNSFSITSNQTIADNEWHHVVINIGKPGTIRSKNKKSNSRFVELWIDGKSDKLDEESLNRQQVFFPLTEWLFVNPELTFKPDLEVWENWDDRFSEEKFTGNTEIDLVTRAVFNPIGDSIMFSGQLNHYVVGVNTSLSSDEVGLRYSLFAFDKFKTYGYSSATATIVDPVVSGNKKRALRLFWNDEEIVDGLQLDNNYLVDTVSVTHKTINSISEVYNPDISNPKNIKILPDVKAAFNDHVNIFGPGKMWVGSLAQRNLQSFGGLDFQTNLQTYEQFDGLTFPGYNPSDGYSSAQSYESKMTDAALNDIPFSNINLNNGDKILLTNQIRSKENGIYQFNGYNAPLTKVNSLSTPEDINNGVVYVTDGIYSGTSWILETNISSMGDAQNWIMMDKYPSVETIGAVPVYGSRYRNENGESRFIDVTSDIDLSKYDLITFMNYPKSNDEIYSYFINESAVYAEAKYYDFVDSIKIAAANGASLFVSSPKLAEDIGAVKKYSLVSQLLGQIDPQGAFINPFEPNEPSDRYFDVHRNNKYHLVTEIPGLTNKETWIMTDFVNYLPENLYDDEQWHIKYSYRQFGLQENDEFMIPGFALRKFAANEDIPGYRQNARGTKDFYAVAPSDILSGTVVTKLSNVYCDDGNLCQNPFDDYATTIVIHNNQLLGNYPITGKIFINCTEDAYTYSREDYNYGIVQNAPADGVNENIATLGWQYSTKRLNRSVSKNIKTINVYGQTIPTNGGGGPILQGSTNSSDGMIRIETDAEKAEYKSDLYPLESEEIYTTEQIPVFSMTWLGLQWLAE